MPVTSVRNVRKMRVLWRKTRRFTGRLRNVPDLRNRDFSGREPSASMPRHFTSGGRNQDGEGSAGHMRAVLLQAQSAVRAAPGRSLRDLSPGYPGGAAPTAPDDVRLPRAASHALDLRLPDGRRAG